MSFIKSYVNRYTFYHTEEAKGIPEWLIEENSEKWSRPFHSSRHSTVLKVHNPAFGDLFIKRFKPQGLLIRVKDSLRGSRAFRAWEAGKMLEKHGICAPSVIAVGEKRRLGLLTESFLVTLPLNATPLPEIFLPVGNFRVKREMVRKLGREIGRIHRIGIIHGDLIPGNIFVNMNEDKISICLLDNESTRKVAEVNINDRIKNLVQLNRVILPRITATDRVRFFDAYLKENPSLNASRDELLRKIGEVTSERVMRHRGIPLEDRKKTTFRAVMSWKEAA